MIQSKLPFHEWLIVVLLIAIMGLLTIIAWRSKHQPLPATGVPHYVVSQDIQVTVEGEIEKPGVYTLKKGAKVQDLLALCCPLPNADLNRLKISNKLHDGQKITVSSKKEITVFIEGAVKQPGPIRVYKGIEVQDLIDKVEFLPEADIKKLQKKRRLKDQEVIYVPIKKNEGEKKKKGKRSRVQSQNNKDNLESN